MKSRNELLRYACALVSVVCIGACSSVHGAYVWADQYADGSPVVKQYVIGTGDALTVQVWNNDKITTKARVRSDGCISVPLLNDLNVAGKTPEQVAQEIEQKLRDGELVVAPRVTVIVDEVKPLTVSVMGNVARTGTYLLDAGSGVAEALASAGGLTPFAHDDRIFVLRRSPEVVRIRFTLASLTDQTARTSQFRLRSGDIVVAE
jgi:polysaccharide export outer membrane protein